MKKMQASVFKARCLKVMERVQKTGEPVIVTKRGKPMVKVLPAEQKRNDLFGFMKGRMEIVGDIESPAVPLSAWNALQKDEDAEDRDKKA
jgi:prevent-host-death family protein